MALSETAKLVVDLSLKGNFVGQIGKATKGLDTFERKAGRAYKAGAQIGTGIKNAGRIAAVGIGILASQVALGLQSLVKLEQAEAQTGAVLKSTGQAAGITGAKVTELAEKYEGLNATIGDEFIRAGQNMLLTFTNIKGKAFEPALEAVLNLNTAMGKGPEGLTKTAILVGKALNDPTKGLTALTRVGVAFDQKQIKRIKSLQKEGKLYEAQQIILAELGKEFGGSFEAQGDTAAGSVAKFGDSIEDLQRSLATAMLPAVRNVADALTELMADPEIQKGVEDLGREIGKLFSKGNIKAGAKVLGDVFQGIKSAAPAIKAALGTVGSVLQGAFDAFKSLPAPIQQLLIGGAVANKLTGGLVTNIAGGIFGALKAMTVQAGVVNVNGAMVNGGGVPGAAPGGGKLGALGSILKVAVVGAIVVEGVSLWLQSMGEVADKNNAILEEFGGKLTANEIAAVKYYEGTKAFQQESLKRLGRIPSAEDYAAALAKRNAKPRPADRLGPPTPSGPLLGPPTPVNVPHSHAKDGRRIAEFTPPTTGVIPSFNGTPIQTLIDRQAAATAAAQETTRETTRGATLTAATARTGSAAIVGAIYANRPDIDVVVNVSGTTVSKTIVKKERYGPSQGSRNRNLLGKVGALI